MIYSLGENEPLFQGPCPEGFLWNERVCFRDETVSVEQSNKFEDNCHSIGGLYISKKSGKDVIVKCEFVPTIPKTFKKHLHHDH